MSEMLKRFDVFDKIANENFLSKIHIACVTENDSIKALIVDSNDDVYVIGKDYNENFEPFKLDGICKSGVCDFSFGKAHVVALTEEGAVFAWGQNEHHQCGNGGKEYLKVPIQIKFDQMNLNEKIKTIKCGWDHTLALTDSGSLYAWGRNYTAQCGTGTRDNVKFPEKLVIGKVKSIACGAGHSMALLENGQVFGWGENGDGQLGLGRETHCERNPTLVVELNGIKKLACGMYHTLALSSSGHLYSCGYNDYGQLGLGNKERRHTPQMVESHLPYSSIAALWCKQISIGLKENDKYYVWGQTKLGDWERPTETNCSSFNEAFTLHIVSIPVTYQCFVFQENGLKTRNKSVYCTVGKINFNFSNKIGSGLYGTRVFKGTCSNLSVAVKRFDYFEMEDTEIKTLLSLNHQNVVRVYAIESDDNLMFRYIAMELADMTFADYIDRKKEGEFRGSNDIIYLKQIAEGLAYLHSQNIIHSNIRPQNVLISSPIRPSCDRKAMITDFAFIKELAQKLTSIIFRTDDGWMAGEILRSGTEKIMPTKEMDIFALGCLFYYVLSDGKHPFGDQFNRQANIYNDRPNMVELKNENSLCKYHLIQAMINKEPSNRPSMNAVLKHPIFWDSETILSFIVNVSNFLVEEKKKKDSPLLINLENNAIVVTRNNWINHIPEELQFELTRSKFDRSYINEPSVRNLLRMIRNKYQHWGELNDEIKQALGSMPDGYVTFFTNNFPRLLIHTYIIFQNNCKKETTFKDYFCNSFDFQDLPTVDLGDST